MTATRFDQNYFNLSLAKTEPMVWTPALEFYGILECGYNPYLKENRNGLDSYWIGFSKECF